MTRKECIAAIEALDIENNCGSDEVILYVLHSIVRAYNPDLCYFFEGYFTEDHVFRNIWDNCHNVEEIADRIRYIDEYTGVYCYGDYGWETANLYKLRNDILSKLEEEEDNEKEDSLVIKPEKEVWVEEDDDFLTKGVK